MNLPYIIAEIGLNHGGDFFLAEEMIYQAAEAGANAVKFQAVKADTLVSRRAPTYFHQVGDSAPSQHAFFARSDALDRYDYEDLAHKCKLYGVDFLCTPFDVETVEWLNPLVPAFKIASADITNVPLLEAVAKTGKPVYLSTGAATQDEVVGAVQLLRRSLCDLTLLHCVLAYPTPTSAAALGALCRNKWWANYYGVRRMGYSDHTLFNLDVLMTAWLLGATVIEKHFTLDKTLPGNDHYHSMDPNDLRALVAKFKGLQAMIGDGEKRVLPCEEAARLNARQSWHATRDLPVGHLLTAADVTLKRPGVGVAPGVTVVGWRLLRAVKADEPVRDEDLWVQAA